MKQLSSQLLIGALLLALTPPWAKAAINVGSSSWVWQNPLPQGDGFNAISCPSTSICYAAGNEGTILYFNGTSWTGQSSTTTANLHGISCPSLTTCFAVGDFGTIVATNTSGSSWQAQNSGTPNNLSAISCPSTSVCFAVGANGVIGTNAGVSTTPWGPFPASGSPIGPNAISCPLTTECYVVYSTTVSRLAFINGLWQNQPTAATPPLNSGFMTSISCVSASTCGATVSGGNGSPFVIAVATTNFGASWSQTSHSSTVSPFLQSLSCFNGTLSPQCFAVGPSNQVFSGGLTSSSWSTSSVSGSVNPLSAVSCVPEVTGFPFHIIIGICVAVGSEGNIITNAPSGNTWTVEETTIGPSSFFETTFEGVSCPQPGTCFATGNGFYGSTNGGAWQEINSAAGGGSGISCPTTLVCFVGQGTRVSVTTNGGGSFASASANVGGFPVGGNAISCPSTQVCVAASQYVVVTTNGGQSWTAQNNFGSALGVSCPSTTSCVVVGQSGTIVYNANVGTSSTWNLSNSGTPNDLHAVSCPTITDCWAVGIAGTIRHGTFSTSTKSWSWKSETPAPSFSTDFYSVSCLPPTSSSSIFCEAFGANSQTGVIITGPGTWKVETRAIDASVFMPGMSCAGSTSIVFPDFECAATGNLATILTKTVVRNVLGTGELTPSSGSSEVGEPTTFELTWTVPGAQSWRTLTFLDLKLADDDGSVGLWARFAPGFPNAFMLLDGNGNVVSSGVPGNAGVLDSPTATLDLSKSTSQAAGVSSPTVTITFSVSFKPAAAGNGISSHATHVYDTEISATNQAGNLQGPENAGSWAVRAQ